MGITSDPETIRRTPNAAERLAKRLGCGGRFLENRVNEK